MELCDRPRHPDAVRCVIIKNVENLRLARRTDLNRGACFFSLRLECGDRLLVEYQP